MKAHIIKIELDGSDPLIWRRVIMPAGATYKRLHDVIQNVTNFQSGYPSESYHLYEFELSEENKRVSNDEEAYLEHQGYKKNKRMFEERLLTTLPDMLEFEKKYQDRLQMEVRKASGLKIDQYLETYKNIKYNYDFGDGWQFTVTLESIVEDYYFGFPTLLDGAETAPPEDVGGLHGYYEFLKAYRETTHPEHVESKEWAESLRFKEYDPRWINAILKGIKYKKTEWGKINHESFEIIEDMYRSE